MYKHELWPSGHLLRSNTKGFQIQVSMNLLIYATFSMQINKIHCHIINYISKNEIFVSVKSVLIQ